jgi:hypothetical protein
MTRYLFLSDSYVLVPVGRRLWREDGSVFCMCRWALPAQPLSGPSPLGLATVFYCLRFETSLFVASYDSQGHGGGIRPRHHTGATNAFFLTPRHGPHREHPLSIVTVLLCVFCFRGNVFIETYLRKGSDISLFVSRSLPSNGSIHHSIWDNSWSFYIRSWIDHKGKQCQIHTEKPQDTSYGQLHMKLFITFPLKVCRLEEQW